MKKIYQIIILCAMGIALLSCGNKNIEETDVYEFLEDPDCYSKMDEFLSKLCANEDFKSAHICLAKYGEGPNKHKLYVYTEEMKFLLSSNQDNAIPRVKIMLAEMAPTYGKPAIGDSFGALEDADHYKSEAELYNTFLSRIVDFLIAIDFTEEAKQFATKGLAIPVNHGHEYKVTGFNEEQANAIAAKVQ